MEEATQEADMMRERSAGDKSEKKTKFPKACACVEEEGPRAAHVGQHMVKRFEDNLFRSMVALDLNHGVEHLQ